MKLRMSENYRRAFHGPPTRDRHAIASDLQFMQH